MLSDFNKNNPFVILMRTRLDTSNNMSIDITKSIIKESIISTVISIIIPLIPMKFSLITILPFLISMMFMIMSFVNLRLALSSIDKKEVNAILYTDKYKSININNEEILTIIESVNKFIGRLSDVTDHLLMYRLIVIFVSLFVAFYSYLY